METAFDRQRVFYQHFALAFVEGHAFAYLAAQDFVLLAQIIVLQCKVAIE
jgi:hypothetical protein